MLVGAASKIEMILFFFKFCAAGANFLGFWISYNGKCIDFARRRWTLLSNFLINNLGHIIFRFWECYFHWETGLIYYFFGSAASLNKLDYIRAEPTPAKSVRSRTRKNISISYALTRYIKIHNSGKICLKSWFFQVYVYFKGSYDFLSMIFGFLSKFPILIYFFW